MRIDWNSLRYKYKLKYYNLKFFSVFLPLQNYFYYILSSVYGHLLSITFYIMYNFIQTLEYSYVYVCVCVCVCVCIQDLSPWLC